VSVERRPCFIRDRWVIVEIDDDAIQCRVAIHPIYRQGGVSSHFVKGYGERAITGSAEYARDYGYSFESRAAAEAWAKGEGDDDA
jgi:hypothetical protein